MQELSTKSGCVASNQGLVWRRMRSSSVQRSCGFCYASVKSCVLQCGAFPPTPYTYHPSTFGFLFHWYLGVTSACFLNSRLGGSWLGSWPWKHYSVLGLAANSGNPWISQALAFLNISGQACTVISIIFRCLGIISLGHKLHQFSASVAARFTLLRAFNPEYCKPGFGCFKSYPLRAVHPQTG